MEDPDADEDTHFQSYLSALLTHVNYRGLGSRIASVLNEHRESPRWDVVIDPHT